MRRKSWSIWTLVLSEVFLLAACGRKKGIDRGEELESAVLGSAAGQRVESGEQVVTDPGTAPTVVTKTKIVRRPLPRPVFEIVPVTMIIEAQSGIPGFGATELPLTGPTVDIGDPVSNGQTPFHFAFDYPANNYQFSEAHVVIDTSRDNSDTEAIFVDGVLSGRPPLDMVNGTSTGVTDAVYVGSGAPEENSYFIDFSLAHYKIATRNTFDLQLADLLSPSETTAVDALSDGQLNVVTGDDSPAFQAYLVIKGLTIADDELTCTTSDTFTFTNVYLHNDGNTVEEEAFSGTIGTPYTSWNAVGTYDAFEFNYDAPLPKVEKDDITLTTAALRMTAKRASTGEAAIVINGIGISETGFDRTSATAVVETWNDDATAAFETFLATVPTDLSSTPAELDLIDLLGADQVRDLLAQGKLNVSVAGSLYARATKATDQRAFGSPVNGPELALDGTYFTEVCDVPDNSNSPLSEDGFVEPPIEYEEVEVTYEEETEGTEGTETVLNDGAGPVIGSLQVLEITSTSAKVVWATDEGSTSTVRYGIGGVTDETPVDETMTTFHQVRITGLKPYKYYDYQVVSTDKFGNTSTSDVKVFVTLR